MQHLDSLWLGVGLGVGASLLVVGVLYFGRPEMNAKKSGVEFERMGAPRSGLSNQENLEDRLPRLHEGAVSAAGEGRSLAERPSAPVNAFPMPIDRSAADTETQPEAKEPSPPFARASLPESRGGSAASEVSLRTAGGGYEPSQVGWTTAGTAVAAAPRPRKMLAAYRPQRGNGFLRLQGSSAAQSDSTIRPGAGHSAAGDSAGQNSTRSSARSSAPGPVDESTPAAVANRGAAAGSGVRRASGGSVNSAGEDSSASPEEGIACEKSVPPITHVIRTDRPFFSPGLPNSGRWTLGPNEAISYRFTAPQAGAGGFNTDMGTNARHVLNMVSVSETPCDFDGTKALSGRQVGASAPQGKIFPCYAVGVGAEVRVATVGFVFPPGTPTVQVCWLKPGKTYYFNIRSYLSSPERDACAEEAKTWGPDIKCGGIWGFVGGEVRAGQ